MASKAFFEALNNVTVFLLKNQAIVPAVLSCILVCSVINPIHIVEWLLVYVLHPILNLIPNLLTAIGNLLLPLSALLIAGVFSCPTKDSFSSWLEEMIDNAADLNGEVNFLNKFYFRKVWPIGMKQNFCPLGFSRLCICIHEGKRMLFIGIFNTWFPLKELS